MLILQHRTKGREPAASGSSTMERQARERIPSRPLMPLTTTTIDVDGQNNTFMPNEAATPGPILEYAHEVSTRGVEGALGPSSLDLIQQSPTK